MTTEDQPAIGSAEWARARPPSVTTSGDLEFRRAQVWTDQHGVTQALISFGAVDVTFHSLESLRAAIARLGVLAGEMDAEITRQHAAEAVSCARCGKGEGSVLCRGDDGELICWIAERCAERVAARDAEAAQVTR